jgi:hypothetical protein
MVNTIYRFTNAADTEPALGKSERITFNTGTVPDGTGKMTRTGFNMVTDLNPHPNPRRALNFIQDGLLGIMEVTVAGYFINHASTLGPKNLFNWSVEEKTTDDFRAGRFGLIIDTFAENLLTLKPTVGLNGTGYMLSDVYVEDVEEPRDEVPFILKFFRNGSITPLPLPVGM